MAKTILVVGGAGYIGSHTNKELAKKEYTTLTYDNLIYGNQSAVKWGTFIKGDLSDIESLRKVFREHSIDAVIHFAAFAYVGESVNDPQKYYINNVLNTLNLLKVMIEFDCKYLIFSSTCATYGTPLNIPMDETHLQNPINPYGRSKLMVETILKDYAQAYGLKYVSLRYFNAAGADFDSEIGENHNPETHLIPLLLDVALGIREDISIFGIDYDTKDGTAIRDYIHVTDLALAHIKALEYILNGGDSEVFNLGTGHGASIYDIIRTVEEVTGNRIKIKFEKARTGDPAVLISDSSKANVVLNWYPKYSNLENIIKTAWVWHKCKKN